ncbi:MAG: hypothetical protein HQL82_00145 [Magnetococcales bacterium]|nr:hypothetical protein [Magnetococcales bacterium]
MIDTTLPDFASLSRNRFLLILMVLLLLRIRSIASGNRLVIALVNLFGTLLHETAHFLVGLALNAQPTGLSLWPRRQTDGRLSLGSVTLRNLRFYNTLPTALAPLLLLAPAWWVDQHFFDHWPRTVAHLLLQVVLITLLLDNALPSTTDVRVAVRNIGGLLFYGALLGGGWWVWRNGLVL